MRKRNGVIEGMQVWFRHNDVAYYHLGAYSDTGYRSRVSYALMWSSLLWFYAAGTTRVDLGGGAGLGQKEDGLTRFKRGWSNASRTVYLCGRILDEARYARLSQGTGTSQTAYFPLYRRAAERVAV